MKKIKENKKTIISLIIVIIVITISVSYAFFRYETVEDEANQFKAACYKIDYSEPEGTGVEILAAYPITDDEAKEEKGYKFTVTNNCEETIKYNVIMNIKNESTTDENLIRVSLNDEVNELSELTQVDSTLSDTKYGYRLKTETLQPTQVREYEVKAWLGEDTQLGEGEDTEFLNQISIEILKESKNALAYKIKANNTLIEETPDFRYPFPMKQLKIN